MTKGKAMNDIVVKITWSEKAHFKISGALNRHIEFLACLHA
jgi:hypothetical protein